MSVSIGVHTWRTAVGVGHGLHVKMAAVRLPSNLLQHHRQVAVTYIVSSRSDGNTKLHPHFLFNVAEHDDLTPAILSA